MRQVVSSMTERWMLVLGAVYIATVLFVPGGLMGLVKRPAGRLTHRAAGPSMPLDGKVASEAEVNAQHGFPQSPRLRRNS
jgi:hypothetical protein